MRYAEVPARVWPMVLTRSDVRSMTPITSLDIYDGASTEFHDDGLYSTTIFGRVGSDQRDIAFSYIDMKVKIIHPKFYRDLMSLKGLYSEIIAGRATAIFDPATHDFIADTSEKAETGYAFFVRHLPTLKVRRTTSPTRQTRVQFIDQYRANITSQYLIVMPAGYRDLEISDTGVVTKNELHDLYYRALSISNTIPVTDDMESPAFDIARVALQNTVVQIYTTIEKLVLAGKNSMILSKWASRRVAYGTRNVLTVMDTSIAHLDDDNSPGADATTLGLFQVIKGLTPVTIHHLRSLVSQRIDPGEGQAQLVDKKTLRSVWVPLSPTDRDTWTTRDGLESVIDRYQTVDVRHRPVEIADHYLALIYKGPDNTFRIFFDIDDLPSHLDKKDVYPLNLVELLYLCGYSKWNTYFAQISRYPISGSESLYASRIYVKTTNVGEKRQQRGDDWEILEGPEYTALEFPETGSTAYMDSQSPGSSRLTGLQADNTIVASIREGGMISL